MTGLQQELEHLKDQGVNAFRQRNYALAARYFARAVEIDPENAEMLERLGVSCLQDQRLHEALDAFNQSIHLNPHRAAAYINAGAIYNRLGDYDKAIDHLQKGIQRNSKSPEAFFNMGAAYRKQGEYKLALSAFKEVLRLRPTEWEAHYSIGKVYRDMRNLQQELAAYRKALELSPDNRRIKNAISVAEQELSETRSAETPFGRLVEPVAPRQNASTTILPVLPAAERRRDREIVLLCAIASEKAAKELLETLRSQLRPVLDQFRTSMTANALNSVAFRQKHHKYRQTARTIAKQRELLLQKMIQMKNHEDDILARLEEALG